MLAGSIMFEQAFRIIGEGDHLTIVGCQRCGWRGQYIPPDISAQDGIADGGEPYTDEEIGHMQALDALERAAERHTDHVQQPDTLRFQ